MGRVPAAGAPASPGGEAIRHGGDLDEARRLFPGAPEPWIDLSTGINPVPYPISSLIPELWASELLARLPAPAEIAALEAAAGEAYDVDPVSVVAAPGTQVLVSLLPRLLAPARVAVVGPTYAEHAAAWRRAGHAVAEVDAPDRAGGAAVAVVVDPNNPDGRRTPTDDLLALAAACRSRGGLLLVDEAFADFEAPSGLGRRQPPGAVVLRSFGKTYGLAGLRLGFALAEPARAAAIRGALGPWAVSGPAIAIGRRALADRDWRAAAAADRAADADRLDGLLAAAGGRIVGGTRLFRTADFPDAPARFARLGRCGIWVRRFTHAPTRLRFGLPASGSAWARLGDALAGG